MKLTLQDAIFLLNENGYNIPQSNEPIELELPDEFTLEELYEIVEDTVNDMQTEIESLIVWDKYGHTEEIVLEKRLTKKYLSEVIEKAGGYGVDLQHKMGNILHTIVKTQTAEYLESELTKNLYVDRSKIMATVGFKPKKVVGKGYFKKIRYSKVDYHFQSVGIHLEEFSWYGLFLSFDSQSSPSITVSANLFIQMMNEKPSEKPKVLVADFSYEDVLCLKFKRGEGLIAQRIYETDEMDEIFSIDMKDLFKKIRVGKKYDYVWRMIPEITFKFYYNRYRDVFEDMGLLW